MPKKKTTIIKDLGDSKAAKDLVDTFIIPGVRSEVRQMLSEYIDAQNERARQAAEKCPDAKEVLREIFPRAFTKDEYRNITEELTYKTVKHTEDRYCLDAVWCGRRIGRINNEGFNLLPSHMIQDIFPGFTFRVDFSGYDFKVSVKEE